MKARKLTACMAALVVDNFNLNQVKITDNRKPVAGDPRFTIEFTSKDRTDIKVIEVRFCGKETVKYEVQYSGELEQPAKTPLYL